MISIRIAGVEKKLEEASESWINQEINRRRADGQAVCVQVTIHTSDLNMVLSTPTCGGGFGGARPPTRREQEVFDLWDKRGLNRQDFASGGVVAFIKQVARLAA
jgi:hypothetical protein